MHLFLNDVLQRACSRGERQIKDEGAVIVPAHTVQQPKVDDVHAELRVNNFFERLFDVLLGGACLHRFSHDAPSFERER